MIPLFIDKTKLPHKPGVYIYKDVTGRILYVGKAVDLYHRVASYFSGTPDSPKTASLLENIAGLETIVVLSEIEALILEANLIKKYLPPYNIRLTDDKDYLYIKVTKEEFPEILVARKNELTDAKEYFGPFPSGRTVRTTLKKLRRIFPWCNLKADHKDGKACFYYHLGLCPGSCAGKIDKKSYNKIINSFIKFMQGRREELIRSLEKEMEDYAGKLQFEQAQAVKRILNGLEYLTQSSRAEVYLENPNFVEDQLRQSLKQLQKDLRLSKLPERIECFDISNTLGKQAVGSMVVLSNGEIDKKSYRKFKIIIDGKPNDTAMMAEVINRRLKHKEWPFPDLFIVDGGRGQVRAAELEMKKYGLTTPIYGMAKRMEWLYGPGEEIVKLSRSSLSLRLIQKIRDEAHRFAIAYHRKLRDKKLWYNKINETLNQKCSY